MDGITYTSLINITFDMYKKGTYLDAYKFITENSNKVNGNIAQIFNFRYCIANKAGFEELALQIMREAIVEKGFWYSHEQLIEDDDLKSLHNNKQFNELINICKERQLEAINSVKPEKKIIKPNKTSKHIKYPLLMSLHGNQENMSITEEYWKSCTSKNYLLALPQSSQVDFSDAYLWDDVEKGSNELKQHYEKILETYDVDSDNIIIGGFSAGGRVALYSILHDLVLVKGFIFVAPWLPEVDEWKHLFNKLKEKRIRGYIVCGDKDEDSFECTKKFVDLLNERNIMYEIKVVKDLGHEYPDNFNIILHNAIEFVSCD